MSARGNVSQRRWTWGVKVTDRLFEVGNNVVAILLLLETSKCHGRTWDVLCARISDSYNGFQCRAYFFGIREVIKKCVLAPDNPFFLVRLCVFEILGLTSMPTDYACHVTNIN